MPHAAGYYRLKFKYHMYGSNIGWLAVETRAMGSTNWTQVWRLDGQQHASTTAPWSEVEVAFQHLVEEVRFTAETGTSYRGDIAIADVMLDVFPSSGVVRGCDRAAAWCARHPPPGGGGGWTAKTVKRPPPHPAQPRHTNDGAPRTWKRHQQEHRPQRPTERSNPPQHAKGRMSDCPGPRTETATRRDVTGG